MPIPISGWPSQHYKRTALKRLSNRGGERILFTFENGRPISHMSFLKITTTLQQGHLYLFNKGCHGIGDRLIDFHYLCEYPAVYQHLAWYGVRLIDGLSAFRGSVLPAIVLPVEPLHRINLFETKSH